MKFKYEGILDKRRPYSRPPGPLASKKYFDAWKAKELDEYRTRLLELFRVHKVEPVDWAGLAMALAIAHVPGMSMEKAKRGPPLVWDALSRAELRLVVDSFAKERDLPIARA